MESSQVRIGVILLLFLELSPVAGSFAQTSFPPLQSFLTEKEYRNYQNKRQYKKRLDIFRESLSRHTSELRGMIDKRRLAPAKEELQSIRALAHYAFTEPTRADASPKDLHSGQVRKLEIRLRKILNTLHDLELSVPFDYRADFSAVATDLENLRNQLLKQIFGT